MSESVLEAPPIRESAVPEQEPAPAPEPWTLRAFMRAHPWWTTGVGIVLLSTAFVALARTRPSYDSYGFLVWGYQTLHLHLDLGGAPSWKPLPYLFTVPYAVLGHFELWAWMITDVAISLAGSIFAGRIAYRLVGGADRSRRYQAIAAAVFAGVAVLGLEDYAHYILSAQSDPMIVTFVLAAIDSHMVGRYRWAFVFGLLPALGRPEVWPFLGLYSIWAWRAIPSMRRFIYAGFAVIAFLWFGIPVLSGNQPLISGRLAEYSPRALHHGKIIGTLDRFTELEYLAVWLAALFAVVLAIVRRNRLVLALAAGAAAWVVVEIGFVLHGWPGLPRYMFEPAAVAGVLAGVALGWILIEAPRLRRGLPRWAGIPIIAVVVAALIPGLVHRVNTERSDIRHERVRTHQIALLQTTINVLGGVQHIRNCGEPVSRVTYVSALAWFVHMNVGSVGHKPGFELHQTYPIVLFTPLVHGGWKVLPWHTHPWQVARCRGLNAKYAVTRRNPAGVLIRG